jgi:hypothetical protein
MDQYILWCLILILLFVLIIILKKKNYLKESFEGDLASVQSSTTVSTTSTATSDKSNTPIAANAATPITSNNNPVPANTTNALAAVNNTTPIAAANTATPVVTNAAATPVGNTAAPAAKASNEIVPAPPTVQKPVIVEGTPAQMGLIFGYLPQSTNTDDTDSTDETRNPNTIYSRDSINIFSDNSYFGYSNKNPLFPNLLEKLGSFSPYTYQTVKIHIKNNLFKKLDVLEDISTNETAPIIYTESIVCFTVKYLQENYFLQYVPNTSTFYLTNTPSFFILLKSADSTNKKEALYGDSIILKCLDNSQYVLIYDKMLITESDKSSSFVIKRGEFKDVCVNFNNEKDVDMSKFLPQYLLDSNKEKELRSKYKTEIEEYVSKLKKVTNDKVKLLQDNITALEGKLANANSKLEIELQGKKVEYQSKIDKMKKQLDDDMNAYIKKKEDEYNAAKKKIETDKTAKWENDLNALKTSTAQKCQKL